MHAHFAATAEPARSGPDAASGTKDFVTVHKAMVERLRDLAAPRIAVCPSPSQFEDVREYIAAVSRIMDAWLYRVGMEVKCNTHGLDMAVFTDQFRGATEGNCEYECTRAADRLREELYEGARR